MTNLLAVRNYERTEVVWDWTEACPGVSVRGRENTKISQKSRTNLTDSNSWQRSLVLHLIWQVMSHWSVSQPTSICLACKFVFRASHPKLHLLSLLSVEYFQAGVSQSVPPFAFSHWCSFSLLSVPLFLLTLSSLSSSLSLCLSPLSPPFFCQLLSCHSVLYHSKSFFSRIANAWPSQQHCSVHFG